MSTTTRRTPSKFTTRIAQAALIGVATLGLTVGVATAPAHAAGLSPTLRVTEAGNSQYWVHAFGTIPMSKQDADRLISTGHSVAMRLWGDDPSSDDLLAGPYEAVVSSSNQGFHYSVAHRRAASLLNEDSGWYEGSGDELYVGVRLLNNVGTTVRSGETNRVHGDY